MSLRHYLPWSLGLSLGLLFVSVPLTIAEESSPAEPTPQATATPLGLELWLSGEEPGATPSPAADSGAESAGQSSDVHNSHPQDINTENTGTANSTQNPAPGSLNRAIENPVKSSASESETPQLVVKERSSGCVLHLTTPNISSTAGACTQENLSAVLESQWHERYGHHPEGPDQETPPASPLEVGVQAIGAVMQTSSNIVDYDNRTQRPAPLASQHDRVMLFPLKDWAPITSVFGWRLHPLSHTWRLHTGTDLGAFWGTPVVAAFSGTVQLVDVLDGYGVTIVIDHPDRQQQTLYGHLSEVFVKPGQHLEQGEVIGRVGSTGNSTGPHLHFELRQWQGDGWVALDAGPALDQASLGHESGETIALVPATLGKPPSENVLQQWVVWFLQVLAHLG